MKELEPPDPRRCQAQTRTHTPFVMGGPVYGEWQRCTRPPTYVAKETTAGADGRKESMSLCAACKGAAEKRFISGVKFIKIKARKKLPSKPPSHRRGTN